MKKLIFNHTYTCESTGQTKIFKLWLWDDGDVEADDFYEGDSPSAKDGLVANDHADFPQWAMDIVFDNMRPHEAPWMHDLVIPENRAENVKLFKNREALL